MVQPRIVTTDWVTESLKEGTRLDEESECCSPLMSMLYTDCVRICSSIDLSQQMEIVARDKRTNE